MLAALGAALSVYAADINMEGLPETGLDTSAWVTGENPPIDDMVDANDFQFAAKNKLTGKRYAYYRTGALDEYATIDTTIDPSALEYVRSWLTQRFPR